MLDTWINANEYSVRLRKLRDAIGADLGKLVLEEEMRQVIRGVIKTDNRLAVQKKLESYREKTAGMEEPPNFGDKAISVRNAAVGFWIRHAIGTINVDNFRSPRMRKTFENAISSGKYESLNNWLRTVKGPLKGKKIGPFDRNVYNRAKSSATGRTHGREGYHVATQNDIQKLAEFIRRKQSKVGLKFAGFLNAAKMLKLRLPKYATRHGGAAGSATISEDESNVTITVVNSANVDRKMHERLQYVLRQRSNKTAKKVARIVRGEAVNLGFGTFDKGQFLTKKQVRAMRLKSVDETPAFFGDNI